MLLPCCNASLMLTLRHRLSIHNRVTLLFYFPGLDDDGSEFHEHIFLDKYLEDFPKQGPIRLFMELVTCGLSKNPYLSVKQKVEHIEWFRNYFNEKRDILKENNIAFT
jgi:small subunit ribosomal protein S31